MNEGVVVPFIREDGIGTCIPLNPLFEVGKGDNRGLNSARDVPTEG